MTNLSDIYCGLTPEQQHQELVRGLRRTLNSDKFDLNKLGLKMKLYLDTEFNGFNGELLSIALVPSNTTFPEFYCEFVWDDYVINPWVSENVLPKMDSAKKTKYQVQQELQEYLENFVEVEIVADWPDDIRYFCELLITSPGNRISIPRKKLAFTMDLSIEYESHVPHHALWDARAIRDVYENVKYTKYSAGDRKDESISTGVDVSIEGDNSEGC